MHRPSVGCSARWIGKGEQKQYGRSVGLRAPGMFIEMLRRTVASTGGTLHEIPTRSTKLSQYCHGCGKTVRKPLWQRWHACACGIGPIQRDLYSADLPAYLDPADPIPSCRSASASKSDQTHTRAALPPQTREAGSVDGRFGTPAALARGAFRHNY